MLLGLLSLASLCLYNAKVYAKVAFFYDFGNVIDDLDVDSHDDLEALENKQGDNVIPRQSIFRD